MKEILHMIVVLSMICSVSGVVLASLKQGTRAEIENQVLTYVQGPSLKKVFAGAQNDPIMERKVFSVEGKDITVFPVLRGGKLVGVALEAYGNGYAGPVGVMVGFDLEKDRLAGIGMTTMSETPGLGTQITEPRFTTQFIGHALEDSLALKNRGGNIDGIAGASYSSAGAVEAVQNAVTLYSALKEQILAAWSS